MRFERDVQHPHQARNESYERGPSTQHQQIASRKRTAHHSRRQDEQAQSHRAAAIAAAQA
jgi:hypothetical protein